MRKLDREIAVLGSTSVGKSALTTRFVHDEFPTDYDPTIFKRHAVCTSMNGVEYQLTLFDTAGLEPQSQIAHSYLRANGFVLVYSIDNMQSFTIVKDIYERLADELMQENIPVVLVGNKSDLSEKRVVSQRQGQELAASIHAKFFETSARTGNNVRDSFHALLHTMDNHNAADNNNRTVNNNNVNTDNRNNTAAAQSGSNTAAKRTSTNAATNNNNNAQRSAAQDGEKKSGCLIS